MSAGAVCAHGFDERYDLPVPLAYVVTGACAVVALTFAAAAVFTRGQAARWSPTIEFAVPPLLRRLLRGLGFALFALTLASALAGSEDPLMNLAPTMVWIIGWLGLSFLSGLVGGAWTLLDPWRTGFDLLDALARRSGRPAGLALGWRWPRALGCWPAAAGLLLWSWLEVVMPLATTPFKLGLALVGWTVLSLLGMAAFGRVTWQACADPFAAAFATLGRIAPLRVRDDDGPPVAAPGAGSVALVMAMLATVVFDGLHGGAAWNVFEGALRRAAPQLLDVNGLVAGTAGLLAVWAAFTLAFVATLRASRPLLGSHAVSAAAFVFTLVPIALAYQVAHNFSSLLIQGQRVFALLSDPFGRQWDLFGTARWYPDIGFVDVRTTWFVAVTSIVLGHGVSIVGSHRLVLDRGVPPRRAALALLPMAALMLGFTAVSLLLISEPMVASPTP
jgi:hypothetical protein